ncbi:MAG: 2-oxoglutarate dehydrogenase E1 component, partial [Zetaproteobacteria bacterium]
PVDWGCAEIMAYATLVADGGWVRITGQDTGRGTFFHRHAIVYDQKTGRAFTPLKQLEHGELSHFVCYDSLLSELAVAAYEYGYSVAEPRALVIWEAQYGDFANNAQMVFDQFVSSGETKWGQMSGLVLWLPHGLEGQGPEHSSARPERFLQLCAEKNMQVVYPTTPAQLFHLLRRQFLIDARKPLVLLGPKGMLHDRRTFSPLAAFTDGRFMPAIDDEKADPASVRRLILCTGKIYHELDRARDEAKAGHVAIARVERLYPFPYDDVRRITARFAAAEEVVWVQEEPVNQGFWYWIEHCLVRSLHRGQRLAHVARRAAAAPASGSALRHKKEQALLIEAALDPAPIGERRLIGVGEVDDEED